MRDVQEVASHAIRGPQCPSDRAAAAWTGTPPTSSPPSSRAPPGNPRGAGALPLGRHSQLKRFEPGSHELSGHCPSLVDLHRALRRLLLIPRVPRAGAAGILMIGRLLEESPFHV